MDVCLLGPRLPYSCGSHSSMPRVFFLALSDTTNFFRYHGLFRRHRTKIPHRYFHRSKLERTARKFFILLAVGYCKATVESSIMCIVCVVSLPMWESSLFVHKWGSSTSMQGSGISQYILMKREKGSTIQHRVSLILQIEVLRSLSN